MYAAPFKDLITHTAVTSNLAFGKNRWWPLFLFHRNRPIQILIAFDIYYQQVWRTDLTKGCGLKLTPTVYRLSRFSRPTDLKRVPTGTARPQRFNEYSQGNKRNSPYDRASLKRLTAAQQAFYVSKTKIRNPKSKIGRVLFRNSPTYPRPGLWRRPQAIHDRLCSLPIRVLSLTGWDLLCVCFRPFSKQIWLFL